MRNWPAHDEDFLESANPGERLDQMCVSRTEAFASALAPVMKRDGDQVLAHGAFSPAVTPMRKNVIALAGKLSIPLPEHPCKTKTKNKHPAKPISARSSRV